MNKETKQCQNCKKDFIIEPDDFVFYEKIKVPSPTWCPECRFQRRLSFFNLFSLYKRKCDLCGLEKISMYPPEAPYRVYCAQCYWSDNWDPYIYGRDYDFSRSFFEQFKELWQEAPMMGLSLNPPTAANSPHNNHMGDAKNVYLTFIGNSNENSAFGFYLVRVKDSFDCSLLMRSELCYDTMNAYKDNRVIGSIRTNESMESCFLRDCINCQNCFISANLRNKNYHVFNKPYSKEDYFVEIKKWDLGSYKVYQEVKKLAEEHWKKFPPKPRWDEFSSNVSGNYVFESKNCQNCLEVIGAQDCKNVFMIEEPPIKDSHDISSWGENSSLCYEDCIVGGNASNIKFSQESGFGISNMEYVKLALLGGSYHFGTVSVKKGDYVILNKKYSKEDFFELREKIIQHMNDMPYVDKKGRTYKYGEFFPAELSPFPYNTTLAQRFFPLSKQEAEERGYLWRDMDEKNYEITKTGDQMPDHIKDTLDSILKEVIKCEKCGRGFKIIPMELEFHRKMNLALPHECPFCRIDEKFQKWIKNLRIFKRACSKCGIEFETSFSEEEVREILCKKCYNAEVI